MTPPRSYARKLEEAITRELTTVTNEPAAAPADVQPDTNAATETNAESDEQPAAADPTVTDEAQAPEVETPAAFDIVPPVYVADAAVVEANSAMNRARAALEAAEAEFSAAEDAAQRALIEDQMRRDQAEDQRIARLGQQLPTMRAAAEFDLNQFRLAVAGLRTIGVSMDVAVRAWMQASHTRETLRRIFAQITAHAAKRSDQSVLYWDRKAAEWDVAMRAAMDIRPRDFTAARTDDEDETPDESDEAAANKAYTDELARVNTMITEQSQAAPIPQNRRPDDVSIPGPYALGVYSSSEISMRNPLFRENPLPRTFSEDLDLALIHAVQAEVDVFLPGISPLSLGGVTVAQAHRLAAEASAQIDASRVATPKVDFIGLANQEQST